MSFGSAMGDLGVGDADTIHSRLPHAAHVLFLPPRPETQKPRHPVGAWIGIAVGLLAAGSPDEGGGS
jgi:hypothetical protein